MTWASDKIKKFALIGTSCSGKTTLALSILAHLKQMGISCDGVLQQDRRFSFDREQLEKYREAQYYFICNQIMRETELTLRGHCEVIVSDRSVLDLYAYYVAMYGEAPGLAKLVEDWCNTYTKLYYLPPLPYVDDKQRPSDEFRKRVDIALDELLPYFTKVLGYTWSSNVLTYVPREQVLSHIIEQIGHKLEDVDLEIIPDAIYVDEVLIGGSYAFNRATKYSDVDVYIRSDALCSDWKSVEKTMEQKIKRVLGVGVDVTYVTTPVWEHLKRQGFREIKRKSNA